MTRRDIYPLYHASPRDHSLITLATGVLVPAVLVDHLGPISVTDIARGDFSSLLSGSLLVLVAVAATNGVALGIDLTDWISRRYAAYCSDCGWSSWDHYGIAAPTKRSLIRRLREAAWRVDYPGAFWPHLKCLQCVADREPAA